MRVSPRDLKAVRAGGILTRYALLGDGAFVFADLPQQGSAGTPVEDPCRQEHWGMVLRGELTLHGRRTRTFEAGTAFYVAPGPVHRFRASARVSIAGFTPILEAVDDSPEALQARGIEVVRRVASLPAPPSSIRVAGGRTRTAASGRIETETAVMGDFLFTRSTFGHQSGYAETWCDLPHWGLVLDGNLVLQFENRELELLSPGDVFHCPGGPPGHRIEVPDVATIIDYTPIEALEDGSRRRGTRWITAWAGRGSAARASGSAPDAGPAKAPPGDATPAPAPASRPGRRADAEQDGATVP